MKLTKLQKEVISQLGYDELNEECLQTLKDVSNHGADGGFGGFIYYTDTIKFYDDNKSEIVELVRDMADSLGECCPFDMIANFNCLKGIVNGFEVGMVMTDSRNIDDDAKTAVKNALAWFALEETAHQLSEVN